MMNVNEKSTATDAGREFQEWANCFSEGLFVILHVYMDESGTDWSPNNAKSSIAPTFCAFIDTPKNWVRFTRKWDATLKEYTAPYFHFREFADKNHKNFTSTKYDGWTDDKRRSFLYRLALLTSESAVPAGGASNAKRIHESGSNIDPYAKGLTMFFEDLKIKLNRIWPDYKGKILFMYDKCNDARIINPLHQVHGYFSRLDPRFGTISFGDDLDPMQLPLQAADLHAYLLHQQVERAWKSGTFKKPARRVLDYILSRNMDAPHDRLNDKEWFKLVKLILADEKRQRAIWAREGDLNKKYYPDEHFPYEKHGYTTRQRSAG